MATNLNVVGLVTIKAKAEGVSETISGIKGVDAAYQGLEKSTTSAGTATIRETKSRLSMADVFARNERRLVDGVRQQQEYERVVKQTNMAVQQFPQLQERANVVLASAADRFGQVTKASRAQDISAYGQELDRIRGKYVPLFAAGQQYKSTLDDINKAARVGAISEKERSAAVMDTKVAFVQQVNTLRGVREANDNATAATQRGVNGNHLAAHELVNLSRQAQDVVVSLGSGQSFGTVLLQQGTQIADVFANSSGSVRGLFDQIVEGAAKVFTPMRLVVGGVVGVATGAIFAAASWKSGQRDIDRALIGIGQRSGVTANDINKIGEASSSAFGLSTSQARESATEFAKTGNIYRDNIEAVTKTVHGFAILTGKDTADAAKELAGALGGDLVKGAEDLDAKLGFLSGSSRELIINLQNQNRIQEAQKIIIDGVARSTERATQTLGPFEKAWAAVGNAMSKARDAVGQAVSAPPKQDQLASLTTRRDALQSGMSADPLGGWGRGQQQTLERLNKEIEKLQQELTAAAKAAADSNFDKFSKEADNAVKAMIPQIEQTQKLEGALADLKRAQADSNVGGRQGLGGQNDAATRAIEVQLSLLKESSAEADRHNQKVQEIAASYNGVGVSTALILDQQKQQLGVAEAVGGAQRMVAQEIATQNELLLAGKTAQEAIAIASGQRRIAQAQINSGAREQLAALREQFAVVSAITGAERMRAQAAATESSLIRQGVSATIAGAVADQEKANAVAQVNAALDKQKISLGEQTDLIRAQTADIGSGTNEAERRVKVQQAYNQAIRDGADQQKAAELAAATATMENVKAQQQLEQAAEAAYQQMQKQAQAERDAADNAAVRSAGAGFADGAKMGAVGFSGGPTSKPWSWGVGTLPSQRQQSWNFDMQVMMDKFKKEGDDAYAKRKQAEEQANDQLRSLQIAGIQDPAARAQAESQQTYQNLIKQGVEASLAQQIAAQQLSNAMVGLKDSVDSNTAAVQATLDPIYTQGHSALKIGYYGEGSGGTSKTVTGTDWGGATPANSNVPTSPYAGNPFGTTNPNPSLSDYHQPIVGYPRDQYLADGGVIPPYGAAIVGEHSPMGPQFFRAGREPVMVTPNSPSTNRDDRPSITNNIQNITFNVEGRSNLGDRQTRRAVMESAGRSLARAS